MVYTPGLRNVLNVGLGAVLFQLAGPDSLQSIESFLHNLFFDPGVIGFPLAHIAP
jgi:protoheme ferro-lyase